MCHRSFTDISRFVTQDHRKMSSMIATQHPLPATMVDFWSMVHFKSPIAVVTLCAAQAKPSDSASKVSLILINDLILYSTPCCVICMYMYVEVFRIVVQECINQLYMYIKLEL